MNKLFTIAKRVAIGFLALSISICVLYYAPDKDPELLQKQYFDTQSKYFDFEGMKVHYYDEGNPSDSIPILLLHGTGASLRTWDGWAERLSKSHRVIRYDLPAFSLTGPHPDNDYSIEMYVRLTKAFLKALNIDRCTLAGNSLGGKVAWRYALAHPNDVAGLCLVAPSGSPRKPTDKLGLVYRVGKIPILNRIMCYVTPRFFIRQNLEQVYGDPSKVEEGLVNMYYDLNLRSGNRAAFVERINLPMDDSYLELNKIQTKTLILWGNKDRWIDVKCAQFFCDKMPNEKLIVYPDLGHVPMEEMPNETVQDFMSFLAAI